MTRFSRLVAVAALPAALLLSLQPIAAHADPLSETVSVSDLNLSTQAGIDAANRRFEIAAHRVCMDSDKDTLSGREDYEACRTEALNRVRPVLDQLVAAARPVQNTVTLARAGD